jgi:dTDP-4-dehydrorhamnose reductase
MRVLVLGHGGMLGNAVLKFLKHKKITALTTDTRWPTDDFKNFVEQCECDFVVNCIGAIPQRKDSFAVNHELPYWLDNFIDSKIIHPGTDCEIDDDNYGLSKRRAVEYIVDSGKNTKIIKTSIIGHEINSQASLLDWFLNEKESVRGYNNHFWNGNTTLQWSKICFDLMQNWEFHRVLTIIATEPVSKYELLNTVAEVYDKEIAIEDFSHKKRITNKCLSGNLPVPNIRKQLVELRKFYNKT